MAVGHPVGLLGQGPARGVVEVAHQGLAGAVGLLHQGAGGAPVEVQRGGGPLGRGARLGAGDEAVVGGVDEADVGVGRRAVVDGGGVAHGVVGGGAGHLAALAQDLLAQAVVGERLGGGAPGGDAAGVQAAVGVGGRHGGVGGGGGGPGGGGGGDVATVVEAVGRRQRLPGAGVSEGAGPAIQATEQVVAVAGGPGAGGAAGLAHRDMLGAAQAAAVVADGGMGPQHGARPVAPGLLGDHAVRVPPEPGRGHPRVERAGTGRP